MSAGDTVHEVHTLKEWQAHENKFTRIPGFSGGGGANPKGGGRHAINLANLSQTKYVEMKKIGSRGGAHTPPPPASANAHFNKVVNPEPLW